jgi:hypothetical protein
MASIYSRASGIVDIHAQLHLISYCFIVLAPMSPYSVVTDAFLGSATCRRKCPSKQLLKQPSLTKAYSMFTGESHNPEVVGSEWILPGLVFLAF